MEFLRSAKLLSVMTLLSRVLGLCRDMITTACLAGSASDALYFAWTIPNLFRKLFGEGALSSAFIPVFSRVLGRKGEGEAFRLARAVITAVALGLGVVVLILVGATFALPEEWILPFFDGDGAKMERTVSLIRILLPYLVIVCALAQCQGVLNSLREFFLPALSPIVLNVAWILAALASGYGAVAVGGRETFIALGIMAGGGVQILLFAFALRRRGFPLRPSFAFGRGDVREVMTVTFPMVLGTSAVQLNILVDRMVVYARVPGDGGVTHLFLGNRLMHIVREKAGIMKRGVDLVTAATQAPVIDTLEAIARGRGAPFWRVGRDMRYRACPSGLSYTGPALKLKGLRLGLRGAFQARNAALALGMLERLMEKGISVSEGDIRTGLSETAWPGRMQVVGTAPTIVLDGAHNPQALRSLARSLRSGFSYRKLILVIGVMADKAIGAMMRAIGPLADYLIFTRPRYSRAAEPEILMEKALSTGAKGEVVSPLSRALDRAREMARPDDLILVCGSLFTVGEALTYFFPEIERPDW